MFNPYVNKLITLKAVDNGMMNIAFDNDIKNPKSIHYYGLDGVVKHHSNGFYSGLYYYGDDKMNCVAIKFTIQIDRKNVDDSIIMISHARLIKDNKLVCDTKR